MILGFLRHARASGTMPETLIIIAIVVITAISAVFALIAHHDARVIARHETQKSAEEAKRTLDAERQANLNADERRAQNERDMENLHNVQNEARERDPDGAATPAGPVSNAVAAELRRQAELRDGT